MGNDANGGSQAGVRQLTNIMRRVYRIFAHAWFQHRSVFWQVESSEGLYMLFKTVCDVYSLIPEENYTIPPEAEGLTAKNEDQKEKANKAVVKEQSDDMDAATTLSTGATTRRHKATPSFSSSVPAIVEGDEDDGKPGSPTKEKSRFPKDTPLIPRHDTANRGDDGGPSVPEEHFSISKDAASGVAKPAEKKEDPSSTTAEDATAGANQSAGNPSAERDVAMEEAVGSDQASDQNTLMEG